jgi:hypothetical protein
MRRSDAGKCPESSSGHHRWIVASTKEQTAQGLTLYFCKDCRKEAMEPRVEGEQREQGEQG